MIGKIQLCFMFFILLSFLPFLKSQTCQQYTYNSTDAIKSSQFMNCDGMNISVMPGTGSTKIELKNWRPQPICLISGCAVLTFRNTNPESQQTSLWLIQLRDDLQYSSLLNITGSIQIKVLGFQSVIFDSVCIDIVGDALLYVQAVQAFQYDNGWWDGFRDVFSSRIQKSGMQINIDCKQVQMSNVTIKNMLFTQQQLSPVFQMSDNVISVSITNMIFQSNIVNNGILFEAVQTFMLQSIQALQCTFNNLIFISLMTQRSTNFLASKVNVSQNIFNQAILLDLIDNQAFAFENVQTIYEKITISELSVYNNSVTYQDGTIMVQGISQNINSQYFIRIAVSKIIVQQFYSFWNTFQFQSKLSLFLFEDMAQQSNSTSSLDITLNGLQFGRNYIIGPYLTVVQVDDVGVPLTLSNIFIQDNSNSQNLKQVLIFDLYYKSSYPIRVILTGITIYFEDSVPYICLTILSYSPTLEFLVKNTYIGNRYNGNKNLNIFLTGKKMIDGQGLIYSNRQFNIEGKISKLTISNLTLTNLATKESSLIYVKNDEQNIPIEYSLMGITFTNVLSIFDGAQLPRYISPFVLYSCNPGTLIIKIFTIKFSFIYLTKSFQEELIASGLVVDGQLLKTSVIGFVANDTQNPQGSVAIFKTLILQVTSSIFARSNTLGSLFYQELQGCGSFLRIQVADALQLQSNLFLSSQSRTGGALCVNTFKVVSVLIKNSLFQNIRTFDQLNNGAICYCKECIGGVMLIIDESTNDISSYEFNTLRFWNTSGFGYGGVIYFNQQHNHKVSLNLRDIIFSNNQGYQNGSLIYLKNDNSNLINTTVILNQTTVSNQTSLHLDRLLFYLQKANIYLQNVKISKIQSYNVMYIYDSQISISYCLFDNIVTFSGSLIHLDNVTQVQIVYTNFTNLYQNLKTGRFQLLQIQSIDQLILFNITFQQIRAMSVDSRFIYLASPQLDINQLKFIDFNCSGHNLQHITTFLFVSNSISINSTNIQAISLESNQIVTFFDLSSILKISLSNIQITVINFYNLSVCDTQEGFIKIYDSQQLTLQTIFVEKVILTGQQVFIQIENTYSVRIKQLSIDTIYQTSRGVLFIKNCFYRLNELFDSTIFRTISATNGSALNMYNSKFNIKACQFWYNVAKNYGGAIYFNGEEVELMKMVISASVLSYNRADYGGGIYYQTNNFSIDRVSTFEENTPLTMGYNRFSYPFRINYYITNDTKTLKFLQNPETLVSQRQFTIESGAKLYIQAWALTEELEIWKHIEKIDFCVTIDRLYKKIDPLKDCFACAKKLIKEANSQLFTCALHAYDASFSAQQIYISSKSVYRQKNNNSAFSNYAQQPPFIAQVYFIPCEMGFFNHSKNESDIKVFQCLDCPKDSYSFGTSNTCYACQYDRMKCVGGIVQSRAGYWRSNNFTDLIIPCLFPEYCLENAQCVAGQSGFLCLQCQEGYFRKGRKECARCDTKLYTLMSFVIIHLFIAGVVLALLFQSYQALKRQATADLLRKSRFFFMGNTGRLDLKTPYIKIFITLFQFINILQYFDIPYISNSVWAIQLIVNPPQFYQYLLTCSVTNEDSIAERLLYVTYMPFLYLSAIILVIVGIQSLQIVQPRLDMYSFATFFTLTYFSPGTLGLAFTIFSCYSVGDNFSIDRSFTSFLNKDYFFYDTTQTCSEAKDNYMSTLFVNNILIWGVGVPTITFSSLYIYQNQLNSIFGLLKFGFLYGEFKNSTFLFELIRLLSKSFSQIVLHLNHDPLIICVPVMLFIGLYGIASQAYQPYKRISINNVDAFGTAISLILVCLGSVYFQNPPTRDVLKFQIWIIFGLLCGYAIYHLFDTSKLMNKIWFMCYWFRITDGGDLMKEKPSVRSTLQRWQIIRRYIDNTKFKKWRHWKRYQLYQDAFLANPVEPDITYLKEKDAQKSHEYATRIPSEEQILFNSDTKDPNQFYYNIDESDKDDAIIAGKVNDYSRKKLIKE